MIDLIKNFGKYQKTINDYINLRLDSYKKSKCRELLFERIDRLNSSWNLETAGARKNQRRNQSQGNFLGQLTYGLVKEQMLTRRSIFTSNFRGDPIFSLRAIGNTPEANAINMQDLLSANNDQIHMRERILIPGIDMIASGAVRLFILNLKTRKKRAGVPYQIPCSEAKECTV